MVYNKIVNGNGDKDSIMGYLAFLKVVEPNTYNNLIIKYSKYCDVDVIEKILEWTLISEKCRNLYLRHFILYHPYELVEDFDGLELLAVDDFFFMDDDFLDQLVESPGV